MSCAFTFFGAIHTQVAVAARLTGIAGEQFGITQSVSFSMRDCWAVRDKTGCWPWVKAGCNKTAPQTP